MFDYIIVDTRPSFDEVTLTLLDHSDKILVMLTLELTSIKGAKQYLELSDLLGYDHDRISLVINRSTLQAGIPIDDVGASLKGDILARLPDEPMLVMRAVNEGVPVIQSAPSSSLAVEIDRMAQSLTRSFEAIDEDEPSLVSQSNAAQKGLGRWMRPAIRKKAS
jgi:pilus assembly protein CpaE